MAWERGIQVPYPFFVFAWHWKTDLNFAFCFSFSPNFEKRFWTSYFVFRFRITLKNGYRFQFSLFVFASLWKTDMNFVFVFRFRITLKNGFEFRFSFSHHFEKQIWISFVVQSFEAPLTGAFTFYVTESKWIFPSAGPKWVVNSPPPSNDMSYTHTVLPFLTMDDKWDDDSRGKTRSRNTCISSMEKENDEHLNTLQPEVTKCEITKNYKSSFTVFWSFCIMTQSFLSFPGYNKLLHHKVLNNWATWTRGDEWSLQAFASMRALLIFSACSNPYGNPFL